MKKLTAFLLFVCCVSPLIAQEAELSYKSTKLADGIYMLEGDGGFTGGNLGLLTGPDGAVLIDDGLPPLTDLLLGAVGKITDQPIEYVVNTHVHGDHTGGNAVLGEKGARIIAHDKLRERMVNGDEPAPKVALPVLSLFPPRLCLFDMPSKARLSVKPPVMISS